VQAPHAPNPQPKRAPFNFKSLRRIYSSGVSPAASTLCVLPLTEILVAMNPSGIFVAPLNLVQIIQYQRRAPHILPSPRDGRKNISRPAD
jgi:hypothetical protein